MKTVLKFSKLKKGVYVPCLIFLVLFTLTFFSEANFIDNFENYDRVGDRSSISFLSEYPEKYSDILITISNLNVNPSTKEIEYSVDITAWLDINLTEFNLRIDTYTTSDIVVLKNGGRASYDSNKKQAWGWYYTLEEPVYINEQPDGYSQRYPYDVYSFKIWLLFITGGYQPNFHDDFQPTISTNPIPDWKTEKYSKPISMEENRFSLDVGVNVARDTTISVFQFMIPTMAIYLIMGYATCGDSSAKLKDKITLFLTISVLTLSLYTFLMKQFDNTPLFVQNIAISLVVSNIILFVFSINQHKKWDKTSFNLWALFLASITPIAFLLFSAYSLMSYFSQIVIVDSIRMFQIFILRYIDYRFLIWLIIFQLAFWTAYLSKTYMYKRKALVFVMGFCGFGIVLINSIKAGFSQEIAFFVLGLFMIIISIFFYFRNTNEKSAQSYDIDY